MRTGTPWPPHLVQYLSWCGTGSPIKQERCRKVRSRLWELKNCRERASHEQNLFCQRNTFCYILFFSFFCRIFLPYHSVIYFIFKIISLNSSVTTVPLAFGVPTQQNFIPLQPWWAPSHHRLPHMVLALPGISYCPHASILAPFTKLIAIHSE